MLVRWLGAYGEGRTLHDSLAFELNSKASGHDLACAEWVRRGSKGGSLRFGTGEISRCKIGLLVDSKAVHRVFLADQYSRVYVSTGGKPHRVKGRERGYGHTEVWHKRKYKGIVVRGRVSSHHMRVVRWWANRKGLPVIFV